MKGNTIPLTETDRQLLLALAANALYKHFGKDLISLPPHSAALNECYGLFVSLYHNGKLRGCIGQFQSSQPLYQLVSTVTLSSAFNDHRFEPLRADELEDLSLEFSVLTPLEPISSPNELELGKHGIYIKKGWQSGTFLPQVASGTNWSKEEFVAHCSKNKAGLGWDGWRTAELFRYEATIFSSPLPPIQ